MHVIPTEGGGLLQPLVLPLTKSLFKEQEADEDQVIFSLIDVLLLPFALRVRSLPSYE